MAYPPLDPGQRDKPMFAGVLLGSDPGHVPGQRRDKQRDPGRKAERQVVERAEWPTNSPNPATQIRT